MKRVEVIKQIDELLSSYCDGCFLRSYYRKEHSKTKAHKFCIHQCTVGGMIQTKGKYLNKSE